MNHSVYIIETLIFVQKIDITDKYLHGGHFDF